jgi:hypothetical protein
MKEWKGKRGNEGVPVLDLNIDISLLLTTHVENLQ